MINYGDWVDKSQLESEIKSPGPKVVLFAADWCGYCRRFISMLKSYNSPGSENQSLIIVNVDSGGGSLWDEYHIDLVPTLIVFKDEKEIFRRNGRPSIGLQQNDLEDALKAV